MTRDHAQHQAQILKLTTHTSPGGTEDIQQDWYRELCRATADNILAALESGACDAMVAVAGQPQDMKTIHVPTFERVNERCRQLGFTVMGEPAWQARISGWAGQQSTAGCS